MCPRIVSLVYLCVEYRLAILKETNVTKEQKKLKLIRKAIFLLVDWHDERDDTKGREALALILEALKET